MAGAAEGAAETAAERTPEGDVETEAAGVIHIQRRSPAYKTWVYSISRSISISWHLYRVSGSEVARRTGRIYSLSKPIKYIPNRDIYIVPRGCATLVPASRRVNRLSCIGNLLRLRHPTSNDQSPAHGERITTPHYHLLSDLSA